jgi:hypothetical protein
VSLICLLCCDVVSERRHALILVVCVQQIWPVWNPWGANETGANGRLCFHPSTFIA